MNVLPREKQIMVIHALTEGCSVRAVERMTGVHRDTVLRLLVRVGNHCMSIMDDVIRDVPAGTIECDEIWSFVGKKDKQVYKQHKDDQLDVGSQYIALAMDRDTKLVLAYQIGKRVPELALGVMSVLSERVVGKPTIITDAWGPYFNAVTACFGNNGADYGILVKVVREGGKPVREGYSPAKVVTCKEYPVLGNPQEKGISTSRIERQNWTIRTNMRRLTRLSNGFSRKLDNLKAATALHFAAYNLTRTHRSLKMTPAMAAGLTKDFWSIADLLPN